MSKAPLEEMDRADRLIKRLKATVLIKGLKATAAERDRFRKVNDQLVEALIWCSGSSDFAPEGKGREGWLKLCQPHIDAFLARSRCGGHAQAKDAGT